MNAAIRTAAIFLGLLATAGCFRTSRFVERGIVIGDEVYRYKVWLPPHYTKLRRWPVILYLSGSDERGQDDNLQLGVGLAPALERFPGRYKAVVVFPQCRVDHEWYGSMETMALAALEKSITEFRGDRRRIYVTGISMGGSGAWFMARYRDRFAAVVPVCGEIVRQGDDPLPRPLPPDLARIMASPDPYMALAKEIGSTPIWAFHGADDDVIPPTESRNMVDALRHEGNLARYTEYMGVGHECWDLVYSDPNMVQWLLAQHLH